MNRGLWIVQWLLALLFLFAGVVKLVLPAEQLTAEIALSAGFLRFIGVAEVLGAIGLVLPGILHIREGLMPLAAAGLFLIMIGATWITLTSEGFLPSLLPFATGLLLAFVIWRHWRLQAT
jgi:hypothetical protein